MDFWTAIVIMVAISIAFGTASEIYKTRLKESAKASEKVVSLMDERMKKVEERMANIETIVLEKERSQRFEVLND